MSKRRKGIIYNCKVGRDPRIVRAFIKIQLIEKHDPDIIFLQEATVYARVLEDIPGYTCLQFDDAPDSKNVAVLIKDEHVSRFARIRTMKKRWWGANNKRWRSPRSVLIFRALGVRWVDIHRVAYQNHEVNQEANREIDKWLVNFVRKNLKIPTVVAGDFNAGAGSAVIQELRLKSGLKAASAGGVTYILYRLCKVLEIRRLPNDGGSDHHPELFIIEV